MILFKLYITLSHNELHHPQSREPTGRRAWQPIKSVVYSGLKHMHSHYHGVQAPFNSAECFLGRRFTAEAELSPALSK